MRLVLGRMGDRSQMEALIRILKSHSNPRFRQVAASTLGTIGATEIIPTLEAALNDPFSVSFYGVHQGNTTMYPVREAARIALNVIRHSSGHLDVPKLVREREGRFKQRLEESRTYAATNKVSPERVIAAANGKLVKPSK